MAVLAKCVGFIKQESICMQMMMTMMCLDTVVQSAPATNSKDMDHLFSTI